MKPRCLEHNRTLRRIPGLGFTCRIPGCKTLVKADVPYPVRQPMARQGKAKPDHVTKGGRVNLSRHHYVGLCYEIWIAYGKRCALCMKSLLEFSTRLFDHIIKQSAPNCPGDTRENLRPLCGRCHDKQDNQGGKPSRKSQFRKKEGETPNGNHRYTENDSRGRSSDGAGAVTLQPTQQI